MPDDDGLGAPPPLTPRPPAGSPPEASFADLAKDRLREIREGSAQATAPWQDAIRSAGLSGRAAGLGSGPSGGLGAFTPPSVHGERLLGGSPLDAAAAAGRFLLQPIATVTHDVQAYKIRRLQEELLEKHRAWLDRMAGEMEDVKRALGALEALPPPPGRDDTMRRLLDEKRAKGDATMQRIDDRLAQDISPEERAKLQAMKTDLAAWMKDRDARVAAEEPDVNELDRRVDMLSVQADKLRRVYEKAAERTFWSFPPSDRIVHTQPQARLYAAMLAGLLLSGKAGLDGAMAPGS